MTKPAPITPESLAAIRARAEASTPDVLAPSIHGPRVVIKAGPLQPTPVVADLSESGRYEDAVFFAHARKDVLALCDAFVASEAALARAEAMTDQRDHLEKELGTLRRVVHRLSRELVEAAHQ